MKASEPLSPEKCPHCGMSIGFHTLTCPNYQGRRFPDLYFEQHNLDDRKKRKK
jgi:hypothetical protein